MVQRPSALLSPHPRQTGYSRLCLNKYSLLEKAQQSIQRYGKKTLPTDLAIWRQLELGGTVSTATSGGLLSGNEFRETAVISRTSVRSRRRLASKDGVSSPIAKGQPARHPCGGREWHSNSGYYGLAVNLLRHRVHALVVHWWYTGGALVVHWWCRQAASLRRWGLASAASRSGAVPGSLAHRQGCEELRHNK